MLEDKILIWKFKCGSRDALRRIYENYKKDLLKLATVLNQHRPHQGIWNKIPAEYNKTDGRAAALF